MAGHKKKKAEKTTRKKLSEKQIAQVIADYASGGSYRAVARKWGISSSTVKRYVDADPEGTAVARRENDTRARDILSYMEGQRDAVCQILGNALAVLADPETMKGASPNQITTAMGTLIDKWAGIEKLRKEAEEARRAAEEGQNGTDNRIVVEMVPWEDFET